MTIFVFSLLKSTLKLRVDKVEEAGYKGGGEE